ncbi:superoxide dismutase family protein [Indioceanicola profundi]|uniref:superoxide dismutase family protein n=1 Tax=Indioceanicola profundi TaxID=2220096 RepID=UPI000E6A99B2|nr:superoxide dismutase family protein [Indioceanicola profundi]
MPRHQISAATAATALLLLAAPAVAQQGGSAGGAAAQTERRGPIGTQTQTSPDDRLLQQTNPAGADVQMTATAELQGPKGERMGTVAFVETPNGTLVQIRLQNVPAGGHGLHIHQNGACEPPDFKSAGGHYAPGGNSHGILSEKGMHAGDLPNVYAEQDGVVQVDYFTQSVQIQPGGTASLLPSGSRSVVLHATVDDYSTDPAGDSGNRIACGVIVSPMADAGVAPEKPGR